jgi:hypothetical protein
MNRRKKRSNLLINLAGKNGHWPVSKQTDQLSYSSDRQAKQ